MTKEIDAKTYTEKQVLGDSQLDKFMEAIKQEPYWYDFFYVEIMTGLRRGEICGIKWSDINFTEGTLSIKRSIGVAKKGKVSIGETKTDAGIRKIVMPRPWQVSSVTPMQASRLTHTLT